VAHDDEARALSERDERIPSTSDPTSESAGNPAPPPEAPHHAPPSVQAPPSAPPTPTEGSPDAGTTALARPETTELAPRGLDRTLRFQRDGRTRMLAFLGSNLVAGGLLLSLVGAPAWWIMTALVLAPALFLSSWASAMRPSSAATRIARARLLVGRNRLSAMDALETISRHGWTPENQRLEAAGHVAMLALDLGDVDRAVAVLTRGADETRGGVRDRGLERGLIGEVMRSILAWLRPEAPLGSIAHSSAFELDPSQRSGLARPGDVDLFNGLVDLLRVLEFSADADTLGLARAWDRCKDGWLARRLPGLMTIARVAASRRIPAEHDLLTRDLARDHRLQGFIEGVFPDFASMVPDVHRIYRVAARGGDGQDGEPTALAKVSAPEEVRAVLATAKRSREFLVLNEPPVRRAAMTLAVGSGLAVVTTLMTQVFAPSLLGIMALLSSGLIISSIRKVVLHSRARQQIAPLLEAGTNRPPEEWAREFAESPLMRGGATGLREHHMLLYVACIMAQRELLDGRPAEAWSRVQWWFRGLSVEGVELQPLYPVAACLLRVAAMAGMLGDARRLADALDRLRPADELGRSAYGSAPRGLYLGRALLEARSGHWAGCADHLRRAARFTEVWMDSRDRLLYESIRDRASSMGEEVGGLLIAGDPPTVLDRQWLHELWPELEAGTLEG
jgi:hypothetical protein